MAIYARQSQCSGKARFESKGIAKRAARQTTSGWRGGPGVVEPYRCPHCAWWHVGHRPPRQAS